MPNVRYVGAGTDEKDIPLLNAPEVLDPPVPKEDPVVYADDDFQTPPSSCGSSWCPDPNSDDDPEQERLRREPDEDGKFYDDPLWYGKTRKEIEYATELEKSNGNAASRQGDWKKANRYWKNALRGAAKIQDAETEFRLHSNLALGYTKQKKTDKAIAHCEEALKERLKQAVSAELRSKVYYRRAEAYEEAGEVSKAVSSIQIALEVQADNAEAKKKLSQLKALEAAQRKRERSMFAGLLGGCAPEPAPPSKEEGAKPKEGDEEYHDVEDEDGYAADGDDELTERQRQVLERGLTDRDASSRLLGSLGMTSKRGSADSLAEPSNMTVGPEVFFGHGAFSGCNVRRSQADER